MSKQTFYNPATDGFTVGQSAGVTANLNKINTNAQAEYELRDSLMSGFFETPTLTIAGEAVSLGWPLGKGGMCAGCRLTTAGEWTFTSLNSSGTYYLMLDTANNFSMSTLTRCGVVDGGHGALGWQQHTLCVDAGGHCQHTGDGNRRRGGWFGFGGYCERPIPDCGQCGGGCCDDALCGAAYRFNVVGCWTGGRCGRVIRIPEWPLQCVRYRAICDYGIADSSFKLSVDLQRGGEVGTTQQ